jgi:hypothetical protein
MIRRFICAVAFLAASVAAHAEPLTLASKYSATGTNPDKSQYTGTVSVEVISDTTFTIEWSIGGDTYKGFGMRNDNALAATYTINGEPGLVIYKVGDDHVLRGVWAIRGESGSGTEVLTPQ